MKIILLFSLLLTSLLAGQTQIVVGTHSEFSNAKDTQLELNKIIEKDIKFKNFLEKNNIKSVTKKFGKHYIVSIEPFYDLITQNAVLSKIRKTKFSDAYILKSSLMVDKITLEDNDPILEEEPDIKDVPVQTKPQNIKVATEPKVQTSKSKNENIVVEYLNEIIAFLVILLISIIYLFRTKKKHKNNEDIDKEVKYSDEKKETLEIVNEEYNEIDNNDTPMVMQKINEINFDAVKEPSLTSDTIKKTVTQHEKIKKDNFKDFDGCRIMIAEDNIINQKVVSGLLSTSGIQIVIVDDGEEVIEYLKNDNDFCIILMDANMPNMDGFEATKIIRKNENYNHITVIALSGDIAQDDIKKMKNVGMQEHLEKPLKMDALYDVLASYSFKRKNEINLDEEIDIQNQQELDKEIGLEVCGGDENFYKEILKDFVDNYSTSKIQNLLNNNQFLEADKLLLDITGIAANIGATNLQNLVKDLKLNLKTPENKLYLQIFKKYAKHYEALENEIKKYLAK